MKVSQMQTTLISHAIFLAMGAAALAAGDASVQDWNGYRQMNLDVGGRPALLVLPREPATNRPWIWRTEFFGHEPQADLALLNKGFHVAYINMENMYGGPTAMGHMDEFYGLLTKAYGLSPKVALEGMSRGGLFALNWAILNPDKVSAIYLDAPVCDFKSWPAGFGKGAGSPNDWQMCKQAYGLNSDDNARSYTMGPLDNLTGLAKAHVPILSIVGTADDVVPVAENTRILQDRYKVLGGEITVIEKPGIGHHPHSLEDPKPIVDFFLKHASPIGK